MSDPLSLLPFALAARLGHLDGQAVAPLVSAGVTLLQRAAPLVRALSGGRSAVLLTQPPLLLVALAASDGREAVLLDPGARPDALRFQLEVTGARAVFTTAAFVPLLERAWGMPDLAGGAAGSRPVLVLLDDAPRQARVLLPERTMIVDLGSHHGLALEGDREAEGRDEPCVLCWSDSRESALETATRLSHRDVLQRCRTLAVAAPRTGGEAFHPTRPMHTPEGFLAALAPLLAGARSG